MKKLFVNENIFNTVDNIEKAYWLGILYTDGNVNNHYVQLEMKDKEHIEKFKQFMQSDHGIRFTNTNTWAISVGSTKLVEVLNSYGILSRKTYDHQPIAIPAGELESHFWRGCFDGDGCIAYYPYSKQGVGGTTSLVLTNNNLTFLQQCKEFFSNKGYINKKKIITKKGEIRYYYQWWRGPGHAKNIVPYLDKLYLDAPIQARLDRKYSKYLIIKDAVGVTS